jgi:hypothetical protein
VKLAEIAFQPLASIAEAVAFLGILGEAPPRDVTIHVTINEVVVPHRRALLKVSTRATNVLVLEAKTLRRAATSLDSELQRTVARISPCAVMLTEALRNGIHQLVPDSAAPLDALRRAQLRNALERQARTELAAAPCRNEVDGASSAEPSEARANAVAAVSTRYLALVSPAAEAISGSIEVRTSPSQFVSFGLVGGAMLTRGGDDNFEVIDKTLQQKPISGPVTAAVIHLHPFSYDPTAPEISAGERFSLFGGIATTPAAGFATGVSLRFFRGLGLQVSHAWLRANRLRPQYAPGDPAPVGTRPFRLGFTNSFAVGISYDLK